jgi:YHS domain-containing protein
MGFLSRVLRFLFWLLIVSWSVALLRRLLAWVLHSPAPSERPSVDVTGNSDAVGMSRRLVRDPVCGAHVAEVLAIPLREGGELLHFCSTACRDLYLVAGASENQEKKKMAAAG